MKEITTQMVLPVADGAILSILAGQQITISIPQGYALVGNVNIVVNQQAGVYPIFDGLG